MYGAFIDVTQAYNTVDRGKLWVHLQEQCMPDFLLQIVKDMYAGDAYELVDADKRTGKISPASVKQGCPLSPLLFALDVNDISAEFPRELGAQAGVGEDAPRVSHVMYADDLTLLANNTGNLQSLLNRLIIYATRKGLTINVQKSQVVVFNPSRADLNQPPEVKLGADSLEVVREFKFLGVMFNSDGCMNRAAEYAARPFMAGIKRVSELAEKFCVQDHPHANLWLFQSFALSAGMYGAQVWGTPHLAHELRTGKMDTDIDLRHLAFTRRVLHVKQSTSSLVALRESGQLPLCVYWLKSIVKFWNACVKLCSLNGHERVACPLLRDVIFADLQLVRDRKRRCWSRDVSDVLKLLGVQGTLATNLTGGTGEPQLCTIDAEEVLRLMFQKLKDPWTKCVALDPRSHSLPEGCGRKMVTYDRWMAVPWEGENKPPLPAYLKSGVPKAVWKNVARFRTSSHYLCIETGRWRKPLPASLSERTCDLCDSNCVQDEQHVLLECASARLHALRDKYSSIVNESGGDMKDLMLEERTKDLSSFIHECMCVIDAEYHDNEMLDDIEETASSLFG